MNDMHLWSWTFKGRTADGNTVSLRGSIVAPNDRMGDTALRRVDADLRQKYPEIKWMQGKNVEGTGDFRNVKFGPSVGRGKFLRRATFADLILQGKAVPEGLNDFIDMWNGENSLLEHLGFSLEEYSKWARDATFPERLTLKLSEPSEITAGNITNQD